MKGGGDYIIIEKGLALFGDVLAHGLLSFFSVWFCLQIFGELIQGKIHSELK